MQPKENHQLVSLFLDQSTDCKDRDDSLWPPCIADADIIFLPCGFFFLFSRGLISAVGDWMSTILPHMVWLVALVRI